MAKNYVSLAALQTFKENIDRIFATKDYVDSKVTESDDLELITIADIDTICGATIQLASEVEF